MVDRTLSLVPEPEEPEPFSFVFPDTDQEIRILQIDGDPWWVAQDVCKILGYGHTPSAVRRLEDDEYKQVEFSQVSPNVRRSGPPHRPMTIVNEPGLYSLILGSEKAEAKPFKRWLTHEVIPSLRKHGSYGTKQLTRLELIELAMEAEKSRLEAERKVRALEPMADGFKTFLEAPKNGMLTREIAKELGFRETDLRKFLVDQKLIFGRRCNCGRIQYDAKAWLFPNHVQATQQIIRRSNKSVCTHHTLHFMPRGVALIHKRLWENSFGKSALDMAEEKDQAELPDEDIPPFV